MRARIFLVAVLCVYPCCLSPGRAKEQTPIPKKWKEIIIDAPLLRPPPGPTKTLIGRGVYRLVIDPKTGTTTEVLVLKTSGDKRVDAVAVRTFSKWKFRPGRLTQIDIPIKFSGDIEVLLNDAELRQRPEGEEL
jgi:TonB family protein